MEATTIDVECLLARIVALYCENCTIPSGAILSLEASTPTTEKMFIDTANCNPVGIPNFETFLKHCYLLGYKNKNTAFGWYSRMKLRQSCSALSLLLVHFICPELKRMGITALKGPDGYLVEVDALCILTVESNPSTTTHHVVACYPNGNSLDTAVDAANNPLLGTLQHNIVGYTNKTGCIDMAAGQFCCHMQPQINSDHDMLSYLPTMERVYPTPLACREHMLQQKGWHLCSIDPASFALRAVKNTLKLGWKGICRNCMGFEGCHLQLKKCTCCHQVYYCSRECQKLDWQRHKLERM